MKILAIIPARGGSKGVPRKNIRRLCGKPLIQYSIDAALKSTYLTEVIVSTEDEEIASVARRLGASVPFLRPNELADDNVPTLDVVLHLINKLLEHGKSFDAICLLQPTTPLRTVVDIDEAITRFLRMRSDSLISVIRVPHEFNPHWTFEVDRTNCLRIATGETEIIPRRQDLPKAFSRNGAIYITSAAVLEGQRSLYGNTIGYYEMSATYHVNIDSEEDWTKAELLLSKVMA